MDGSEPESKSDPASEPAPKPDRPHLSESDIKADIRKRAKEIGVVIWAQATGKGQTDTGSDIRFGLCRGSSDLIGLDSQTGLFVAVEVKTPRGLRAHESALKRAKSKIEGQRVGGKKALTKQEQRAFEQQMFVDLVNRSRGVALFATSFEDVKEAVSRARPLHRPLRAGGAGALTTSVRTTETCMRPTECRKAELP